MKKKRNSEHAPLLRLRSMLAGMLFIVVMISGPLVLVWKQVYINSASLHMDSMRRSLDTLQKEITMLKLSSTRLSSADRIERIAREKLHLEYSSTSQIYVVHVPKSRGGLHQRSVDIVTFFRKMITGERS